MRWRQRTVRTICDRQNRVLRRIGLALVAVVLLASQSHADEVSIATELTADSVLPLAPGVADTLATNILNAQANFPYAAMEADSLALSITAVLRAISLEQSLDGATEIVSKSLDPIPFLQSEIAIDDRVSLTLSPSFIDFGTVDVPEPGLFLLTVIGLVAVGFLCHLRFGKGR